MSFGASIPTSSYGRSVSPINYNTFVRDDGRSTSNMTNSKANMPSPPLISTFTRDDPTPSPTHPVVNRHLGSTSYKGNLKAKVDPKVNVSQVNPASSSRKRPLPRASAGAQKKLKLARSAPQELLQQSNQNSPPAIREETPGFEEFLERENLMLHGVEEDDVRPDSEEDDFDFGIEFINSNSDLKKSNVKSNPENNTNKSNLDNKKVKYNINAGVTSNNSKLKPKPKPIPSTKDNSYKGDVATLRYSQLKRLCTAPPAIVYYGPDDLLTTTTKANFRRMVLDQLHAINRDKVPEKFHPILDQVIKEKTVAFQDELDDIAYDLYFPDDEVRMENYRIFEYKGNRTVATPLHHFR
jgi:hypothetical protein